MIARSSTGSGSSLGSLNTLHPVLPCPFDAPETEALQRKASTTVEQNAVLPTEPIVLRRHRVGIRNPADAVDHEHVPVLPWRQGNAYAPLAVLVGSVQRMCLRVPAVEGAHHADPLGLGCFHVKLCRSHGLEFRRGDTTHQQWNDDEGAKQQSAVWRRHHVGIKGEARSAETSLLTSG